MNERNSSYQSTQFSDKCIGQQFSTGSACGKVLFVLYTTTPGSKANHLSWCLLLDIKQQTSLDMSIKRGFCLVCHCSLLTPQINNGSFIPDIFIHLFKSTTAQHWYCVRVNTPKGYRQLWVKDLPIVPTWLLEYDLNLRPSGRKAPNLPVSDHAPQSKSNQNQRITYLFE